MDRVKFIIIVVVMGLGWLLDLGDIMDFYVIVDWFGFVKGYRIGSVVGIYF